MDNGKLHFQTIHDVLPYLQHLVTHDMQSLHCIIIAANDPSSARNSSRRQSEIHGRIPCAETQWQVLGTIIDIHNYRATVWELLDTWRPAKRKVNYSEPALGLVHVSMCNHQWDHSKRKRCLLWNLWPVQGHYLNERDPVVRNNSLFNIAMTR